MGTSADYAGGTGGAWTSYKTAVNTFAKHGGGTGGMRAKRVLSRYVAARGGASAVSGGSSAQTAIGAGQDLATFASGIATDGLSPTLERLGMGALVGKDRYEMLDGLIEALAGDGGTLEEQSILSAVIAALDKLFPADAESYGDLENVTLDADAVRDVVESFVAEWAYYEMAPTFAEKFTHIEDPVEAHRRDEELRDMISDLVKIETDGRDALSIDWAGTEGQIVVQAVVTNLYSLLEEDSEQ